MPSRIFATIDVNPNTFSQTNWLKDICADIRAYNQNRDPWTVPTLDLVDQKNVGSETLWFCDWGGGWSFLITVDDRWTRGRGFETKWVYDLRHTDGRRFIVRSIGYRPWESIFGRAEGGRGTGFYKAPDGFYRFNESGVGQVIYPLWQAGNYTREQFGETWTWERKDPNILLFVTDQGFGNAGCPSGGDRGESPPPDPVSTPVLTSFETKRVKGRENPTLT